MSQISSYGGGGGPPGMGFIRTITPDAGVVVNPDGAQNVNIFGTHGINTSGAGSTLTVAINNTVTLGDLAVVTAGNDALTITSGDITISGTGVNAGGNLNMPNTAASGDVGIITFGGDQWIHNLGAFNTFVGRNTGNLTLNVASVQANTAIGAESMQNLPSATFAQLNTAVGWRSLRALSGGLYNTAVGANSLVAYTSIEGADGNTALGCGAGIQLLTGELNIFIGQFAGSSCTGDESSNIYIGNTGFPGESNTVRIGNHAVVPGDGNQTSCFIAGIATVSVANTQMVTINATTGQLGSQVISGSGSWTVETGASVAMVVNRGYIANNAGTIAFALPATAAVGSIIEITGINNATGWRITQAAGQQIFFGATQTTLGATGTLTSSATRDAIKIVCVVANTTWQVLSVIGTITVV